jgi:hypothetical protein
MKNTRNQLETAREAMQKRSLVRLDSRLAAGRKNQNTISLFSILLVGSLPFVPLGYSDRILETGFSPVGGARHRYV